MKIVEYSPEQFDSLEPFWKKLESGRDMTIFQTFTWYKWVNSAFLKEKIKNYFRKWIYLVCQDDSDEIVMIAPIQIVKVGKSIKGVGLDKGAYFIGRKKYSDYMSFIYSDFYPEAVDCILDYLKKECHVKNFFFEFVLENTDFSNYLIKKYNIYDKVTYSSAALSLPQTFDDYYSSLKKHAKQNFRTAFNRQKRDGLELSHELIYNIDADLKEKLLEIRSQRLKEKQNKAVKKFSSKLYNFAVRIVNNMFDANMNIFDCYNKQWCFLVKHDDRIVGFYWGIFDENKKHYYVIYAGVDKKYSWYSPSLSHLFLYIKELYNNHDKNIRIIDFTVGDERYKTDIGGTVTKIQQLFFRY